MSWKFWRTEKSQAQLDLERLQARSASELATSPGSPPTADASAGPPGGGPRARSASGERVPDVPTGAFVMPVEDVFTITGRGTVVTGTIQEGTARVGLPVDVLNPTGDPLHSRVTGIEAFRRLIDSADAGENVGILLTAVSKQDVQEGAIIRG